jgi:hypothetical protein
MSDRQDGYWIIGHADGIGERPTPAGPLTAPQKEQEARQAPNLELDAQPDLDDLEELTEILNYLDRLRDPD